VPIVNDKMPHHSHTAPDLPPRDRCPKAILNPATDHYDPQIAAALMMHMDADAYGWSPAQGGTMAMPSPLVAALRIVRSTFGRMQALALKPKTKGAAGG